MVVTALRVAYAVVVGVMVIVAAMFAFTSARELASGPGHLRWSLAFIAAAAYLVPSGLVAIDMLGKGRTSRGMWAWLLVVVALAIIGLGVYLGRETTMPIPTRWSVAFFFPAAPAVALYVLPTVFWGERERPGR